MSSIEKPEPENRGSVRQTLLANRALSEAEEKLAAKAAALATLHAVGGLLTTTRDPDALYRFVAELLVDRIGYEVGLIVSSSPTGVLGIRASCACTRSQLIAMESVLKSRTLVQLQQTEALGQLAEIFGVPVFFTVPIVRPENAPDTAIIVGRARDGRAEADDADLLSTLAGQVGVGLENSALYAALARETETLEARVAERTSELSAALDALQQEMAERRYFEEQLTHQAFHDSLTGLPNRSLFMDRLRQALSRPDKRAGSVGIIILDLDNFKVINDSLGHDAGDRLLRAVAERLQDSVRPGDTVARFGGDEFVVLLEQLSSSHQIIKTSERIAEVLISPISVGDREIFTCCSLGIAVDKGDDEPDSLLRDADTAMSQAKTGGKSQSVVFDRSMNSSAIERLELETDMRRALDQGQFRVYYQPIVHLKSERIIGLEALVRWEHPSRGLVAPGSFIPLAEETGLILPIGRWVLGEACRQVHEWHCSHPSEPLFSISVNLSARQLQEYDLVDAVSRSLSESGLTTTSLKLEITETAMMQDTETTIPKLAALRDMGVRLAVDDFGTGYSSMSYLSTLPVDTLKIDRSFVSKMGPRNENIAIVRAIITLARTLGLHVTSEGIETLEQLEQLRSMGCDQGQGYLFSKPLPAASMSELIAIRFPSRAANAIQDIAA